MPRQTSVPALVLAVLTGGACDAGDDGEGGLSTSGEPPMMTAPGPIPTDAAALGDWLEGFGYLQWDAESSVHPSTGPHFGGVRTFLSPELVTSLQAGNAEHPMGSATVKELYGDGDVILGWSVSVKLAADSAGGDNWYWYELYDGSVIAEGEGVGVCTGCHGGGTDYVLTPFPLQ